MEEIHVVSIDGPISIAVYIFAKDWIVILVIYLLINVVGVCRIAHLMHLDIISGSAGDSSDGDAGLIACRGCQFGDFVAIVGDVRADRKAHVRLADYDAVHICLETFVLKVSNVGIQVVRKIRHRSYWDVVEQVGGLAIIAIQGKSQPVIEEAEVYSSIVGSGGLPFEVGVVAQGCDRIDQSVPEIIVTSNQVAIIGSE